MFKVEKVYQGTRPDIMTHSLVMVVDAFSSSYYMCSCLTLCMCVSFLFLGGGAAQERRMNFSVN